ncbi:MAG TPA: hypothetical protein VK034_10325, partial [Enhygromyxa sp.]|nr:hypothetical protein [Enhygromyxa sp.]
MAAKIHAPEQVLDQLYAELGAYGPELTNGFTSHAPMVAEALCVMGQAEAARRWVRAHLHEGVARKPASSPIDRDDWQAALGLEARFADWAEFMRAELGRLG